MPFMEDNEIKMGNKEGNFCWMGTYDNGKKNQVITYHPMKGTAVSYTVAGLVRQ